MQQHMRRFYADEGGEMRNHLSHFSYVCFFPLCSMQTTIAEYPSCNATRLIFIRLLLMLVCFWFLLFLLEDLKKKSCVCVAT